MQFKLRTQLGDLIPTENGVLEIEGEIAAQVAGVYHTIDVIDCLDGMYYIHVVLDSGRDEPQHLTARHNNLERLRTWIYHNILQTMLYRTEWYRKASRGKHGVPYEKMRDDLVALGRSLLDQIGGTVGTPVPEQPE